MSADALTSAANAIAMPVAIGRTLTPAEVAAVPSGYTLAIPAAGPSASAPYTPAQIRHTYGVDQLSYDGTGQTIAIVDAYNDPTIANDLALFDKQFGLPAANLTITTPPDQSAPTTVDSGWSLEVSLDVEWSHAIAPGAKIVLIETNNSYDSSLLDGVSYAYTLGASQVSMSWGGGEFSGESSDDSYFDHPGTSYFASSGDSASEVLFPAISPYVTSVGGTTLSIDSTGNRISEGAWASGGGGSSTVVSRPSFQNGFTTSAYRGTPDVSYDADPNTGFYIYDNGQLGGVGGTSSGAPQWAGLAALANQGLKAAGKAPLGTGQTYGTNSLLYQLAGATSYTNPNGDFLDITTGNNGHPATTGYDLATGLGSPVANKLIPDLIGTLNNGLPTIGDSSFEAVPVGSSYVYNPSGSAWTFSGTPGNGSGVAGNNSLFTSGNPAAPQGTQVAFLQANGTITQSVAGWVAGNYTISFQAAQRANHGTSVENFEVLVNGSVVGTFQPSSTSYQTYTTATFTVPAGSSTVEFLGLDSAGGDNTAFLDSVTVSKSALNSLAPSVGDSSFEAIPIGNSYVYNPSGSAWTFSGTPGNGSGVAGNNSLFTSGNPAAPQGTQVAFLQANGTITQSVPGWTSGSYTISFEAAQRGNHGTSVEDFEVLVDGSVVGTFQPSGTSYQLYQTGGFSVSAGSHTIEFLGLDSAGGDNTAFLDAITVSTSTSSSAPSAPTPGDSGFEVIPIGPGTYAYNPTGSSWAFSGTPGNGSGVSGNNSPFTSGNPNAPQGSQVAFLQATGTITQSVAGWSAGNYTISFQAAQRGNHGTSVEDFEILIDGNVVGTFKPSGTSYQTYTTGTFAVSAGAHTIKFLGLDSAGGDNTAFLDAVTIAGA